MNTNELVKRYIDHAPDFYQDLDLKGIDDKHSNILKEAYKQFEDSEENIGSGFRSWKGQNDLAVPSQFTLNFFRSQGYMRGMLKYGYRKILRRKEDEFLRNAILDDIDIIKGLGGSDLLMENPVHLTPGAKDCYFVSETSVSLRWLRYIYILKRVLDKKLLSDGEIWVDVGSFYGGLQGLVRKYRPKSRIVLVDFHHQLCRSYIYLSKQFPDAKHILPDQIKEYTDLNELPEGSIMYVPVSEYEHIAGQSADLVTNFFSLGEMRREFFNIYMTSQLFKESKRVLLVNRFVSAPFFEKTYDTDIAIMDYRQPDRTADYFDIFPMHHYLLVKRELFGRECFRNMCSPYFEMITYQS